MLLDKFYLAKQNEVLALKKLAQNGSLTVMRDKPRPSFIKTLQKKRDLTPHIIAEYKRASPSKGDIALNLTPAHVAKEYKMGGASCISVLTEENFFKGHIDYLTQVEGCNLPILRKDFIFDPLQIIDTARTPASALLLIVGLTPNVNLLRELREQAESFGMDAVVEIFNETELPLARDSGARIIQVNARDLNTFKVDRGESIKIAKMHRQKELNEVWIAASGISKYTHLIEAHEAGYDAVLVGTHLMECGTPFLDLKRLITNS